MSVTIKWIRDQKLETNLFKKRGIKFEVEEIPFSKIDLEEGLRHQVRLSGKLKTDTVLLYASRMEAGDHFPMCVLQKEKHKYWTWSGNHRLGGVDVLAVNNPDLTVEAYVVDIVDPVMRDLFPRQVNLIEAVEGMSKEEQIINARQMVEKHGLSVAEAAREFGLKKEQVYLDMRVEVVKKKIESFGVNASKFSSNLLNRLHAIESGVVLRKTTSLLNKYDVKGKEAEILVCEVRKTDSEAAATVCLEKWETALTARQNPKKRPTGVILPHREINREQLFRLLTSLERYLEMNNTVTKAKISDPVHLDIVKSNWKKIKARMAKLLDEGKE